MKQAAGGLGTRFFLPIQQDALQVESGISPLAQHYVRVHTAIKWCYTWADQESDETTQLDITVKMVIICRQDQVFK